MEVLLARSVSARLYDSVGIGQEAGVLEPILHPVVDGLVNLGPSFRVEAYDLQSRMILAEPAFDSAWVPPIFVGSDAHGITESFFSDVGLEMITEIAF